MIFLVLGWGAILLACFIIGMVSEYESDSWMGWLIVSALILWAGGWLLKFPAWDWIRANAASMPAWITEYIGSGVVWSILKFFFVARNRNTREEIATAKACVHRVGTSKEERDAETLAAKRKVFHSIFKRTPGWIAFWPLSIIATILKDWLHEIFEFLADCFKGVYKKIFEIVIGEKL